MRTTTNDKLQTPDWVIQQVGHVDLDPCAGEATRIGALNYTALDNGLRAEWFGFVFCNPPFSQKQQWIRRMIDHGNGILLLPERGSAPWFAPLAQAAMEYWVMGRKINFVGGPSSNNVGSVLFLFGNEAKKRARIWSLPGHLVQVCRTVNRT